MTRSRKLPDEDDVAGSPQLESEAQRPPTNSPEDAADRVESIARRAYERFLMRGGEHGRDEDDWLAAEQEMNNTRGE
jgi:hypothetical protein